MTGRVAVEPPWDGLTLLHRPDAREVVHLIAADGATVCGTPHPVAVMPASIRWTLIPVTAQCGRCGADVRLRAAGAPG